MTSYNTIFSPRSVYNELQSQSQALSQPTLLSMATTSTTLAGTAAGAIWLYNTEENRDSIVDATLHAGQLYVDLRGMSMRINSNSFTPGMGIYYAISAAQMIHNRDQKKSTKINEPPKQEVETEQQVTNLVDRSLTIWSRYLRLSSDGLAKIITPVTQYIPVAKFTANALSNIYNQVKYKPYSDYMSWTQDKKGQLVTKEFLEQTMKVNLNPSMKDYETAKHYANVAAYLLSHIRLNDFLSSDLERFDHINYLVSVDDKSLQTESNLSKDQFRVLASIMSDWGQKNHPSYQMMIQQCLYSIFPEVAQSNKQPSFKQFNVYTKGQNGVTFEIELDTQSKTKQGTNGLSKRSLVRKQYYDMCYNNLITNLKIVPDQAKEFLDLTIGSYWKEEEEEEEQEKAIYPKPVTPTHEIRTDVAVETLSNGSMAILLPQMDTKTKTKNNITVDVSPFVNVLVNSVHDTQQVITTNTTYNGKEKVQVVVDTKDVTTKFISPNITITGPEKEVIEMLKLVKDLVNTTKKEIKKIPKPEPQPMSSLWDHMSPAYRHLKLQRDMMQDKITKLHEAKEYIERTLNTTTLQRDETSDELSRQISLNTNLRLFYNETNNNYAGKDTKATQEKVSEMQDLIKALNRELNHNRELRFLAEDKVHEIKNSIPTLTKKELSNQVWWWKATALSLTAVLVAIACMYLARVWFGKNNVNRRSITTVDGTPTLQHTQTSVNTSYDPNQRDDSEFNKSVDAAYFISYLSDYRRCIKFYDIERRYNGATDKDMIKLENKIRHDHTIILKMHKPNEYIDKTKSYFKESIQRCFRQKTLSNLDTEKNKNITEFDPSGVPKTCDNVPHFSSTSVMKNNLAFFF